MSSFVDEVILKYRKAILHSKTNKVETTPLLLTCTTEIPVELVGELANILFRQPLVGMCEESSENYDF